MQAVTSAQLIAVPCRVAEKRGSVAALPRKSFAGVKGASQDRRNGRFASSEGACDAWAAQAMCRGAPD